MTTTATFQKGVGGKRARVAKGEESDRSSALRGMRDETKYRGEGYAAEIREYKGGEGGRRSAGSPLTDLTTPTFSICGGRTVRVQGMEGVEGMGKG